MSILRGLELDCWCQKVNRCFLLGKYQNNSPCRVWKHTQHTYMVWLKGYSCWSRHGNAGRFLLRRRTTGG